MLNKQHFRTKYGYKYYSQTIKRVALKNYLTSTYINDDANIKQVIEAIKKHGQRTLDNPWFMRFNRTC